MISAQTRRVYREGKPLHTFPDHALTIPFLSRAFAVDSVVSRQDLRAARLE
jgi:hypothetical protein